MSDSLEFNKTLASNQWQLTLELVKREEWRAVEVSLESLKECTKIYAFRGDEVVCAGRVTFDKLGLPGRQIEFLKKIIYGKLACEHLKCMLREQENSKEFRRYVRKAGETLDRFGVSAQEINEIDEEYSGKDDFP